MIFVNTKAIQNNSNEKQARAIHTSTNTSSIHQVAMALRRGASTLLAGLGAVTTYRYSSVKAREGRLPQQPLQAFDDEFKATTTKATNKDNKNSNNQQQQRVIIIGAGVVGVTTAYKLAQRGHKVTVLEPRRKPGEECSACAAGGMSRQNVVVDKDSWMAVSKCLMPRFCRSKEDSDYNFFEIDWIKSLSDPFFLRWVSTFTMTSLFPGHDQEKKQLEMLKFTKFAVDDMVKMMENRWDNMAETTGYCTRGSLSVSYDDKLKYKDATTTTQESKIVTDNSSQPPIRQGPATKMSYEPNYLYKSTNQILQVEPSLRYQFRPPTSAKYEYEAKAASSGRFSKEIARRCETDPSLDVKFLYDVKVMGVGVATPKKTIVEGKAQHKPRISELRTNRGTISVPDDVHVVVAAGAWTPHVLALLDLYAPVYPLKGYALSVSAKEVLKSNPDLTQQDLPSRIVADKYMYTTRLGDEIRITSIGEFSEWNSHPTPHVDDGFRKEAIRQFPQLKGLVPKAKTYCGHRPFVSDGILLLGAVDTHEKLYVTCGPGSNGWKLCMGSGDIIARLVSGQTTSQIEKELGFDGNAFSPAGRVLYSPIFAKVCRARWNI